MIKIYTTWKWTGQANAKCITEIFEPSFSLLDAVVNFRINYDFQKISLNLG